MSYDFATEKQCDHTVFLETSSLDPFVRNTVRFQRPPASSRVQVTVDGIQVPPDGLWSTPSITFTRPEPYRVKVNKNDLLYLSVGNEPARLIQIVPGSAVPAKDIAQNLQRQVHDLAFDVVNGRVRVSARRPTRGRAFTFHDPRWTDRTGTMPNTSRVLGCYQELGIVAGRAASGTLVFPGWDLVSDPNSFVDEKIVLFKEPLLTRFPTVQLTYVTDAANCRRCFGTRFEFDYTVKDGTYETVSGADLLFQEFDKFLFTRAGSHWKWPWVGTNISDRIGGKAATASGHTQAFITMDVTQAFRAYQDIKTQQDNLVFQRVTDDEYPVSLDGLSVEYSPVDPTIAVVSAGITTRARGFVELKRIVGNPSPFYLDGNPDPFRFRA